MTPEQLQAAIAASSTAAIALFDGSQHCLVFCTDAWRKLWGDQAMAPDRPLSRDGSLGAAAADAFDRCLTEGATIAVPPRTVDGRLLKLTVEPWRDEVGRPRGVLAHGEDVSEADAEQARLLNMLGHELRGPMAPLLTAIDLTRIDTSGASTARALTIIERQAKTLLQRLDNLLDVGRAARGKLELFSSRIDLGERVRAGIDMIRHRIDQRGHKVEVQVEDGIPIDGDARRVSQMVANLVDNAVLYSDPAAATAITVRCQRRGADAVIEVSDSGQGIPASELERVFAPFVQGPRVSAGLGLGLTFVRQVAELHGGTAVASSEGLGRGSTFTITLPIAR